MTDKNTLSNNINNVFANLGSLGVNTFGNQIKDNQFSISDSINAKKSESYVIENKNAPFKAFSYQEDKNLKYRQSMEDIGVTIPDLTSDYRTSLFGIFDGHGGTDVVKFIKDRLPQLIKNNLIDCLPVNSALEKAFEKIDQELKFYDSEYTGSTATIILTHENTLYCANVGDSKAFIIDDFDARQISTDHKCTDPSEMQRIAAAGGKLIKGRVMGSLILSRTLGDLYVKRFGVSCIPSVSATEIKNSVRYVVVASDGVWDTVDKDCLMGIIKEQSDVELMCKKIVRTAIDKGSRDNVSCIVIKFR